MVVNLQAVKESQSIDIDPNAGVTSVSAFQPGKHGFGFKNWTGTESWSVDGETVEFDPADVSEDEVRQLVEDIWPADRGKTLVEPFVKYAYTMFNRDELTNGYCYGMVHTAMEYFENPSALPENTETASDVPYPARGYESVSEDIRYYHQSQLFDNDSESSVLSKLEDLQTGLFSLIWPGYGDIDHRAETEELTEAIDSYGYAPISLADPKADSYHQVLGYEVETMDDKTVVFTYDPNAAAKVHDVAPEEFRLEIDNGQQPAIRYYDRNSEQGYTQFASMTDIQRDADLREVAAGAVIATIVGAADGAKSYLQPITEAAEQRTRLLFAGLRSPATLEVTGPGTESIIQPEQSETDHEADEYSDVAFVFGAEAGEYSYTVNGENDGAYTLELLGASADQITISEKLTEDITAGEHHTVVVTIPDSGTAEVSVETGDGRANSVFPPVEMIGGGGVVAMALLYGAYRMKRSETDTEP